MSVIIDTTMHEVEALIRYARIGANNCMIGHSWEIKELVRCKDCKWSYDAIGGTFCSHGVCVDCVVYDDWFCAGGERKDGEA